MAIIILKFKASRFSFPKYLSLQGYTDGRQKFTYKLLIWLISIHKLVPKYFNTYMYISFVSLNFYNKLELKKVNIFWVIVQ